MNEPDDLACATLPTPLGVLTLVARADALVGVRLPGQRSAPPPEASHAPEHPVLALAAAELTAYFSGALHEFETPLHVEGTPFQRSVWRALAEIPYGHRTTYAALAAALGRPRAVRAVGAANARNPLPLFLPCHRVVGRDGALVGYSGGVDAKRWLLGHEDRALGRAAVPRATPGAVDRFARIA